MNQAAKDLEVEGDSMYDRADGGRRYDASEVLFAWFS
jgi:hypothetical protein